jgi:hypothetical protein
MSLREVAGLLLGLPRDYWVVARAWQNRPALRSVGTEALTVEALPGRGPMGTPPKFFSSHLCDPNSNHHGDHDQ